MTGLTPEIASGFVQLTLGHLEQQWPYKLDHVMTAPEDVRAPIDLHPIFHGSYDWHSCVHGWWQVMYLLRRFPGLPEGGAIREKANRLITSEKVAGEVAYLARPSSAGFERPYGWGWLLALHGELMRHDARWGATMAPLARAFAARFTAFLPKLTYPIRTGTHFNTAFALIHALEWAREHDPDLAALIRERALGWYGRDHGCTAFGEPGGDEFLSPALTEALLMSRILDTDSFRDWFAGFLPEFPPVLLEPAYVSDRSDGKIAHLDGLNFARAWCWRGIAATLGPGRHIHRVMMEAADRHIDASLPHIADDYMGSHWLASFALLALEG